MPTYEVTAPNGQVFEVDAPDGATEADVLSYAQSQFAQMQQASRASAQDKELYDPTAGMPWYERFAAGAGKAITDIGRGAGQLADEVVNAMSPFPQATKDRAVFGPTRAEVEETRRLDAPLMQTPGGVAGNITGNILAGAALPGGTVMQSGRLLPALAIGAGQGAALSGVQPVGEGESRLENTGTGALFGAGGTGLARGIGRLLDPLSVRRAQQLEVDELAKMTGSADDVTAAVTSAAKPTTPPAREAATEVLRRYGIEPTVAQRTGAKPLQTLESVLGEMPSTSGQVAATRAAQQQLFQRQLAKFMGESGDDISEEVIDKVLKRGNDLYEQVGKSVKLKIDDDALNAVEDVWQNASLSLGTENKALFQQAVDRILKGIDDGMSGKEYVKIRSQLSKASTSSDRPFAEAMRGLRSVLDDTLERSAGQKTADQLRKARQEMRLALLLRESGAEKAQEASIRKLANVVERANRKGKMPEDIKEFTRAASMILPDYAPNSGTAQRTLMQNMLTGQATPLAVGGGLGLMTGDPIMGLVGAGAYYGGPRAVLGLMRTPAGQRWLSGQAAQLPPWAAQAAAQLPLAATMADR